MSLPAEKPDSRPQRPASNWAQIVSAITSSLTVLAAFYALFFSPASQAIVQYFKEELSERNNRIDALQNSRTSLEREISEKERQIGALDRRTADLQANIATLERQRGEAESAVGALRAELESLSKAAEEARQRSVQSEFAYVRERLAGAAGSVIIVTWPIAIVGEDRVRGARRETLWPQYVNFYRQTASTFAEGERRIAERIVQLFIRQCARFQRITFDIPAWRQETDPARLEAALTARQRISRQATAVGIEIMQCMRDVRDE